MTKQTFIVGIPTKFKTFDEWIEEHDRQARADERAKVIENYCWLKCKCNGKGCVGTPDECFVVTTLECDKLTIAEQIGEKNVETNI